ncbi:MAG: response regulator, partial [gamma proteobacterium symbiont of Taylorina sp.]|nr:response regulator [gamma proteobacterium symbiont of Taylorina sp.]
MSNYSKIATILYVEDEEGVRQGYERALKRHAKELYIAADGERGLELFIEYHPDIVVTDINMPKMNGIEMAQAIKKINPDQQIIITTAHSETGYFMEAIELQINGYLLKPVDKNILTKKILEIAKNQKLNDEVYEQQALMKEVANLQNNMLIVYDNTNTMIFANTAFMKFFNIKNIEEFSEQVGALCSMFIQQEDFYSYNKSSTAHWTQDIEHLEDEKRLVAMNNRQIHHTVSDSDDVPSQEIFLVNIKQVAINNHKICTFSEVTSITNKKNEFEIKAYIDELTQIPNRAKFNQVLNIEIKRYHRDQQKLSLIMFDIDHFKRFNDTHGHQMG